jgi:hypothetical protein
LLDLRPLMVICWIQHEQTLHLEFVPAHPAVAVLQTYRYQLVR